MDIAHNQSWLFGQEIHLSGAFKPIVVVIGIIAVFIILANLILGRVFCGWICPGGFLAQVQEYIKKITRNNKPLYYFITLITSILFSLLFFNWITDLRVFLYPTNPAFLPLLGAFTVVTGFFYFEAFIADKWCRVYCPTGIYHKITPFNHIVKPFLIDKENCGDCKECIKACPMGLDPRKMASLNDFDRGIQACIICGECVDACEITNTKKGKKGVIKFVKDINQYR
jgi:ferredoxin-type protein NapH